MNTKNDRTMDFLLITGSEYWQKIALCFDDKGVMHICADVSKLGAHYNISMSKITRIDEEASQTLLFHARRTWEGRKIKRLNGGVLDREFMGIKFYSVRDF